MAARAKRGARVRRLRSIPSKRLFGRLTLKVLADAELGGRASIVHERMSPGTVLPVVFHRRTSEWVYCLAGEGWAVIDGRRHPMRPGVVLFLPPGARHQFIAGRRPCEALSVFVPRLTLGPGGDVHAEG